MRTLIRTAAIVVGMVLGLSVYLVGETDVLAHAAPAAVVVATADIGDQFGPVNIPQPTRANGATLPAGAYLVRITGDTSDQERWVEFLSSGQVAGRELATMIPTAEISTVAKLAPPPAGAVRVDILKGADYVRVWINDVGTHYLIHLPLA